ncbi:hypothetical protein NPIL_222821 [Nephila pilipes]|uniref:Uncharacterized protein n=1 Tax=Nephila pilipes TaxID=299642 RepID=A0A8X6Q4G7_NEPPI|nr:hypothetical protein NPIL_222821 [Nephila pilipes]
MLRIEDRGKSKRLSASSALLVPAADSDANVSISAATAAERVCLRLSRPDLTRSSFLKSLSKLDQTMAAFDRVVSISLSYGRQLWMVGEKEVYNETNIIFSEENIISAAFDVKSFSI